MIYALCAQGIACNDEAGSVLEYVDEAAAEQAFREYIQRNMPSRRYSTIVQRYLFRSRDEAESANQTDDEEVQIDESKAFRVLDWERGYGFNF